jgi:hypothetical protein
VVHSESSITSDVMDSCSSTELRVKDKAGKDQVHTRCQ